MSYKKVDWKKIDPIDVWKAVKDGELKVFPNNYLDKEICRTLIRKLILDELKFSRTEILNVNYKFLSKYKLGGTRKFFDGGIHNCLIYCFPEFNIKEWEFLNVPNGFWKYQENRTNFIKWIAEKENLDLSNINDIKKISSKKIKKYGGSLVLKEAESLFLLLKPAINKNVEFNEWNLVKIECWSIEKAITAIKWLIEKKLNWSYEEVYANICVSIFYKNDLGGMLSKVCNNSPIVALQLAYPGKFKSLRNKSKDV